LTIREKLDSGPAGSPIQLAVGPRRRRPSRAWSDVLRRWSKPPPQRAGC